MRRRLHIQQYIIRNNEEEFAYTAVHDKETLHIFHNCLYFIRAPCQDKSRLIKVSISGAAHDVGDIYVCRLKGAAHDVCGLHGAPALALGLR